MIRFSLSIALRAKVSIASGAANGSRVSNILLHVGSAPIRSTLSASDPDQSLKLSPINANVIQEYPVSWVDCGSCFLGMQ